MSGQCQRQGWARAGALARSRLPVRLQSPGRVSFVLNQPGGSPSWLWCQRPPVRVDLFWGKLCEEADRMEVGDDAGVAWGRALAALTCRTDRGASMRVSIAVCAGGLCERHRPRCGWDSPAQEGSPQPGVHASPFLRALRAGDETLRSSFPGQRWEPVPGALLAEGCFQNRLSLGAIRF